MPKGKEIEAQLGVECDRLGLFISIRGNCAKIGSYIDENMQYEKICDYFNGICSRCGIYVVDCTYE